MIESDDDRMIPTMIDSGGRDRLTQAMGLLWGWREMRR